ncbi:MAG: transglutaminase [Cyanobacteria bacterium SZAS-4]|nr:transglutaminase [Cyanobacteria bacterium SZAS-4]
MIGSINRFVLRIVLSLLFYATPVLGFWLASSLAAYFGGPTWLEWAVGALLFPILPGFWEFYTWAWRDPNKKAFLTPLDRIGLRTFVIGLTFCIGVLCFYPQTAFVAISTRGDWMLNGKTDAQAETARHYLFAAANGLEWLYRYSKKNPYTDYIDENARKRTEVAEAQLASQQATQTEASKENDQDNSAVDATASSDPIDIDMGKTEAISSDESSHTTAIPDMVPLRAFKKWPWKQTALHPVVVDMPKSAETSISAVAHYIAQREKDPTLRIKALHDWVADRVAYDSDAFYSGKIPAQDAQTTFNKRLSVCAGYANLLSALGDAIHERIVVVEGNARSSTDSFEDKLTGCGHAWNAAKIQGQWYLLDACWDAGYVDREKGFTKKYKTDYLLPPPAVMVKNHLPDDQTWQLLATPLTQSEFLRQPMLSPAFQAANLTLVSPDRARNEMGAKAVAVIKNPGKVWLETTLEQNGASLNTTSASTNSDMAHLEQMLPNTGTYRMNIFMNKTNEYGLYQYVGSIDFVNR